MTGSSRLSQRFRVPKPTPYHRAGQGEPLLMLHPFLLSHDVYADVVPTLANDFDVVAMTLPGHWGGPRLRRREVSLAAFADRIEEFLDELGWETCHLVGNSIGGWLSLELAARGRARSVTAIAPAGGWTRLSLTQIIIGAKFLMLVPLILLGRVTGDLGRQLPFVRNLALKVVSHKVSAVPRARAENYIRSTTNTPAFLAYLWADLRDGGIQGLHKVSVPVQFIFCSKDWLTPVPRYSRMFVEQLPRASVVTLEGVGHVPTYECPDRVAELIRGHIESLPSTETA